LRGEPLVRGINPRVLVFVLSGVVLLLGLLGSVAGVAAFLLFRAGYGFMVWGLLPPLALLLVAVGLGAILLWASGGIRQGAEHSDDAGEKLREGSADRGPRPREDRLPGDDV
jgi:hypothetical protein